MNGRFLLDTNVIIALFAKDPKVHERMDNASEVFVPSIVVGELYYGASKSSKLEDNRSRIDDFAKYNTVLSCDAATAKIYGDIKNRLKEKGRPIPDNDIWIAAIAKQYSLILVTSDFHFDLVDEIKTETWQ